MDFEWGQATSAESWEPEQVLMDRYRVKECVRQSGTCHLYRVQDVFRGTFHLVLRPSPRIMANEGWREWFEQRCQNALSVPPHANVLTCERMTQEGDLPFLIMENVEGRGWDSLIFDGSLLDLPRMLDVALQVAQGLAWLHSHRQIHGNVKPANVFICDQGAVKVWKHGEANAKTRAYASPEQLAGAEPLTDATDVWSWAVSVLHTFVGKAAWKTGADAPAALRRYIEKGPARAKTPLMPAALVHLLSKCLKSAPAERLVTMDEIVETMKGIHDRASSASRVSAAAPRPPEAPPEAEAEELFLEEAPPSGSEQAQMRDAEQTSANERDATEAGQPGPAPAPPKRFHRTHDEQRPGSRRRYHRP